MLALDAVFNGIDPTAWRNLSRLLRPPGGGSKAPLQARRPLILFVEYGRVEQMLRPGPLPSPDEHAAELDRYAGLWRGPASLKAIRRAAGAPWLLVLEDDAPRHLAQAIEGRLRLGDDLLTQAFSALEAIREQVGTSVHMDPNPFIIPGGVRAPQILRAIDLMLPDQRALVLYVLDRSGETAPAGSPRRPRIFTSLVVARRRGQIALVTTHLGLGLTEPSLDLRRDARKMNLAVAALGVQPHLGLFITLNAWRQVVGPQPGALAKAVALGDAVMDPAPAWMMATTGLGAATGIAEGAGKLLGRFIPKGVMEMAKQVGMSPFQALGIDPLDLWNRVTGMARSEEDPRE